MRANARHARSIHRSVTLALLPVNPCDPLPGAATPPRHAWPRPPSPRMQCLYVAKPAAVARCVTLPLLAFTDIFEFSSSDIYF